MSTVNVNRVVDASGGVLAPISSVMRNRIINGAMVIDQRNAGASVTPTGSSFTLDRWAADMTQSSKFSVEQTIAGVAAPVGFTDYLGVTSTSAYSVLTGDTFIIRQIIEGFNIADLGWGTANAKTVTLSFWVRSSLTGTFGGALSNGAATFRSYPFSYTISSANTWEQKSITIVGDTTGTWATNNTSGLSVRFGLGSGATFSGTAGAWATGNFAQPTGTTSVVGTNGATFYITGVQLEVGTQATSFEYRQHQQELALCQRYFINWVGNFTGAVGYPMVGTGVISTSTQSNLFIPTPVPLRATPTTSFSGTVNLNDATASTAVTSIGNTYISSSSGFWVILNASAGGFTVGRAAIAFVQNSSANSFSASSEL
jgi:hypothetical protein